jgi:hypothetical protein
MRAGSWHRCSYNERPATCSPVRACCVIPSPSLLSHAGVALASPVRLCKAYQEIPWPPRCSEAARSSLLSQSIGQNWARARELKNRQPHRARHALLAEDPGGTTRSGRWTGRTGPPALRSAPSPTRFRVQPPRPQRRPRAGGRLASKGWPGPRPRRWSSSRRSDRTHSSRWPRRSRPPNVGRARIPPPAVQRNGSRRSSPVTLEPTTRR